MNEWKGFETRVLREARLSGLVATQIPSKLTAVRGKTFRNKTDCDFAISLNGRAVFLDAKVCEKNSFNFKGYVMAEKKIHQYRFLRDAEERGAMAGYLVWFSQKELICWVPIKAVDLAMSLGHKGANEKTDLVTSQSYSELINLSKLLGGK